MSGEGEEAGEVRWCLIRASAGWWEAGESEVMRSDSVGDLKDSVSSWLSSLIEAS